VANESKFGVGAFGGGRISPGGMEQGPHSGAPDACSECEAMLADALDGTLSTADQEIFDAHMLHCAECSQMLADARRGAAWLEMLRSPRPEPPAALLEKILAQTTGFQTAGLTEGLAANPADVRSPLPVPASGRMPIPGRSAGYSNVLPFRVRIADTVRRVSVSHVLMQPRFAMTAAMAFFSIALTMNLSGVRIDQFRASDLKPASVKREFYDVNARVVRYYEGLRVVYELESRVRDLQRASEGDAPVVPDPNQGAPAVQQQAPGQPSQSKPQQPAQAPSERKDVQPQQKQDSPAKQTPGPGTSHREVPEQTRRLVAFAVVPSRRSMGPERKSV
jgi:hypothetical protein